MYSRQIKRITDYIKSGEKNERDLKLGVEIEHFVVYKDTLKSVSYYGEDGVESSLRLLLEKGWNGKYEGNYLLGLEKDDLNITLEPGSQLEVSILAKAGINDIDRSYLNFLDDVLPILENKNQTLVALGYHPQTRINEIKLLPKKRYDLMFNYFKSKGSHAHNMMKGTGAFQVAIDYLNQEDYIKKFRVINALSPVFYGIFENAYIFEGEPCKIHNIRSFIWSNCDDDRAGTVKESFSDEYSYEKYAEYILERPPIFTVREGRIIPTEDKLVKDILDPDTNEKEELEHLLTMFFPDARTKRYIEIRMMDAVPYPLNISAVALIKGIFYNEKNLDVVYDFIKDISYEETQKVKNDILISGVNTLIKDKTILEVGRWLVELSKSSLGEEKKYLMPLEDMLNKGLNPYLITKEAVVKEGVIQGLSWAMLKR